MSAATLVALAAGPGGLFSSPWFYAVVSAAALAMGAGVGIAVTPGQQWQAILLAIGGGSLVISLAFELFQPAVSTIGQWWTSGYFVVGVVAFGGLDIILDRLLSDDSKERGWGLWWSVTTDGIPENAAMGSLLVGNVHGALAFLFALVITNGSQSMMSGGNMAQNHGAWKTLGAWAATGIVVGASVLLGYWYIPPLPDYWLSAVRSFAGGAILASLAGEIFPDAYDEAGPYVTLATAIGFLGSFLLR